MADSPGEIFKLWPTTVDQESYQLIMECQTPQEVRDQISKKTHLAGQPIVCGYLVRQAKTGFSIDLKCDQHVK
jgi:hypothetical protein